MGKVTLLSTAIRQNVSKIQEVVRKGAPISIQTAHALSSVKVKELDAKVRLTQQVDSIALLSHISHELACLRRYKIRSVLKLEFVSICTDDRQSSKFLFSDDLQKRLKEAKENSSVGQVVKTGARKLITLRTNHTTRALIKNEIMTMNGRNMAGQTTNQHPDRIFTVEESHTLGRKA